MPAFGSETRVQRLVTAQRLQPGFANMSHEKSNRGIQEGWPDEAFWILPGAERNQRKHGEQTDDPMLMPFHAQPVVVAAGEVPVDVDDDPQGSGSQESKGISS